jgi:hypothetical protein
MADAFGALNLRLRPSSVFFNRTAGSLPVVIWREIRAGPEGFPEQIAARHAGACANDP